MSDLGWLLAANTLVWIGLGGWLAIQHARYAALSRKLEILERTLRAGCGRDLKEDGQ